MKLARAGLVIGLTLTSACALLSKSEPRSPRYFSPEAVSPAPGAASAQGGGGGLELRIGRVSGQEYLRDKIVHRDSEYELGYYDGRLWTERPDWYVRRAVTRAIFEERGVSQVIAGNAPTLDVTVVAFEEVRKPAHVGRVELSYVLYDDRVVKIARSLQIERPIADAKGDAEATNAVSAIADALSAAVESVADAAVTELRSESASSKPAPRE
jgi:cholesterol transport system auxiliary component